MKHPLLRFALALLITAAQAQVAPAERTFNVKSYGATGDGKTKDTAAIQKSVDACFQAGGGEVDFPAGTYLTGSIELKSHVHLLIPQGVTIQGSPDKADYPLATARWEGNEKPAYLALIRAKDATDIAVTGSGTIQGDYKIGPLRNPRAPTLIEPISCTGVVLNGMTLHSHRIWTVHPTYCQDVSISNLTIQTKGANGDGIDPDSCQHVTIDHCSFDTDDDNIAIKSGKGQEGVKIGKPSQDITITNCTFLHGYSSIAFGSELSGGIQDVRIAHCIFQKGRAALYLKSRPGRAGYINNVTADDLQVGPEPLLEIDINYKYTPDNQGIPGPAGLTKFQNITITNARISGTSAVKVVATTENPADGITLSNITGTCGQPWIFQNAKNVTLKDIHVTGFQKDFLSLQNTTGTGLDQTNH